MTKVKYDIGGKEIVAKYDENGVMEITRELFESLIEKQIPKKPKFEHRKILDLYVCECGVGFGNSMMMIKPKYCHNCGQKIDWSEVKKECDGE